MVTAHLLVAFPLAVSKEIQEEIATMTEIMWAAVAAELVVLAAPHWQVIQINATYNKNIVFQHAVSAGDAPCYLFFLKATQPGRGGAGRATPSWCSIRMVGGKQTTCTTLLCGLTGSCLCFLLHL